MRKSKPSVKYQGISFETPFIAEIKKHIMFNSRYRSIADFAREAIREKMRGDQSEAMEKEPVVQLSKSELTDMIRNVVTEILDKKEKK